MKILTPVRKVSFGIVMMTISLLLLAEWIGIVPNEQRGYIESRKSLSESIAVQLSTALGSGEKELVKYTLETMVERDNDIVSAAIISRDGRQVLTAGRHQENWAALDSQLSTSTHVQVPIYHGREQWGSMQFVFAILPASSIPYSFGFPLFPLLLFFTVFGFITYLWFVKRTLKELDPSSVIPERVRSAFDTLAEGLVIIDEKENIILANTSFADKVGVGGERLVGQKISQFNWQQDQGEAPWKITLKNNQPESGVTIRYQLDKGSLRTFTVNTTPIADSAGKIRGAMATFNDLTDLERKQIELKDTVNALQVSRQELQKKTVELEFLATRDSLTGCLNRRAFFEKAEILFLEAMQSDTDLACIMTDIDHFKAVNDNHGHATGDKVIQMVAGELRGHARPDDLVGRYGGEEFCIILPGVNADAAAVIGERLRIAIETAADDTFDSTLKITSSFGVSVCAHDLGDPADLVNRADEALYRAKETGRNKVVTWIDSDFIKEEKQELDTLDQTIPKPLPGLLEVAIDTQQDETLIGSLQQRVVELEQQLTLTENSHAQVIGKDGVTGLPNRLLLLDRVRQAATRNERFDCLAALIVLDIDLFRRINDTLGFVIGDKVLHKVGDRLSEILREGDSVALLGGDPDSATLSRTGADEFAILVTDLKDADSATWIVKRLLDNMSEPFNIDGNEIFISCSAGISLYPLDATQPEQMLGNASIARYTAKRRLGRNNFAFFSEDLNQSSFRNLWLEGQMHKALDKGEFSLNFQPKVDIASRRIVGMESLLRWHNPKLGFVSPVDFIPVAEHTGLINEIGQWVIEQSCAQAQQWAEAGFADVGIAVNLSPIQFRQNDLCEKIFNTLTESNLSPEMLELEVTESAVMENFDEAVSTLVTLAKAGIKISIDDFGTGYSSLAYLKKLPVKTLKIDRSFLSDTVPDEQDKQIITAIIAMAHSMRLNVVAEGVETEAQLAFLTKQNCDQMQGYLFSKPVQASDTFKLLEEHNGPSKTFVTTKKIA